MTLRTSQVEVLRAVAACDGQRATPAHVGGQVACSLRAGRERLERLRASGHLYAQLALTRNGRYYRREFGLTQLGKQELERHGDD